MDNIVSFRGVKIYEEEVNVLKQLESLFGKQFHRVESFSQSKEMEYIVINREVLGISITSCNLRIKTLERLDFSFGKLGSLRSLYLSNNDLRTLPAGIGKLQSLEILNLDDNRLKTLPEAIGELQSLEYLYVRHNLLEALPESFGKLSKLKILNFYRNNLEKLPVSFGNLRSLQILELGCNNLKSLPESIGKLASLVRLNLCENDLETLPESFGKLRSLYYIDLTCNKLKTLPKNIDNLESFRVLNFEHNNLETLPESIGKLQSLEILNLNYNHLKTLPEAIEKLGSLRSLDLRNNDLRTLPADIGKLQSLKNLSLSGNKFEEIDVTLLNNCNNLNRFYIGPSVKLYWTGTELPEKNSLTKGLQGYYTRLILKDEIYERSLHLIQRLKIFCVGVGGGGKTSLLKRIQNKEYIEGRDSTVGLDIEIITLNGNTQSSSQQIIWWDYGGQSGYLPTHRFFFARDAVYLLVLRADHDIEQNKLFEWISSIRGRAPYAIIIPIATWGDRMKRGGRSIIEGTQGKELTHLLTEFNVVGTPILVSNKEKEDTGIKQVKLKLKTLLQEIGSTYQVPKGYTEIEDFVKKLQIEGFVFMTREDFLERLDVELKERQWEGVKSLWLHRMGIYQLHENGIIFYANELFPASDLIIVNVDQANKVLATIIDEVSVFNGVVRLNELQLILEEKCPFSIDSFKNLNQILDLLGELGLAYRDLSAKKEEETWIFPLYLTKAKKEWQDIESSWKRDAYSKASFSLNSVDETLFSRLLYQLSFNGHTIGIWREKKLSEGKDIYHALITLYRNPVSINLPSYHNTQGLAINLVSYHRNKKQKDFIIWFNNITPAIEIMVFETSKRYLRQEYQLNSSKLTKLKDRKDYIDSKIAKDIYDKVAKDYLFLNEKLDRQFYHFNAELRKIILTVEDLQAYVDNNIDRLKEFIGQLQKKLPLPKYMEIDKKYFGIKKQLTLSFTCGSQKEGCTHTDSNAFTIITTEWSKWLKISLSAVKIGYNILTLKSGGIAKEIKTIKELKEAYDTYKAEEFPDFLSFAREPFLISSERDDLIQNLRDHHFFNSFEYESINTRWICKNCAFER